MPGIYRPRHPERTVLYRVPFHYFERFLTEYEGRFEKEYGYFRPVLSLGRLSLDEREGRIGYRWGRQAADPETMDYLEFIARELFLSVNTYKTRILDQMKAQSVADLVRYAVRAGLLD